RRPGLCFRRNRTENVGRLHEALIDGRAPARCLERTLHSIGELRPPCRHVALPRQEVPGIDDAEYRRLTHRTSREVCRDGDDATVRGHEQRHAERRDQVSRTLDRGEEFEVRDGRDLLPAPHCTTSCRGRDCPSRTTRRKMSSIGASIGSKRSIAAPGCTRRRPTPAGGVPLANINTPPPT